MDSVTAAVSHLRERDILDLTASLVRIPSETGQEKAIAHFLAQELETRGVEVTLVESPAGRLSVLARVPGETEEWGLILVGHIDTVPPDQGGKEGWRTDPYRGDRIGNRFYGLGSADMMAGIAAILAALQSVMASGVKLRKGLTLAFCADEERGSTEGMKYIAENRLVQGQLAMSADTTNGCLQGWFKGRTIFQIETKGKSAHTSSPSKGVNAVHHMVELIHTIKRKGFHHRTHPLLGSCTTTVGVIQGGRDMNSIPDHCEATLEVRTVPGQTGEGVKEQISAYITSMKARDPTVEASVRITVGKDPMALVGKEAVLERFQRASRKAIGRELELGRSGIGGGDLYFLWKSLGIPCINFGPGNVELAHSANEYVEIDKLIYVSKCYVAFILEFCEAYA